MAYVRRKGWEEKRLALAIVRGLGIANAGPPPAPVPARQTRVHGHRWVSGAALLGEMGVKIA
jgi:hypothetical protein